MVESVDVQLDVWAARKFKILQPLCDGVEQGSLVSVQDFNAKRDAAFRRDVRQLGQVLGTAPEPVQGDRIRSFAMWTIERTVDLPDAVVSGARDDKRQVRPSDFTGLGVF